MLEPRSPSETVVESSTNCQHKEQRPWVAEGPLQLRHVFEIHSVDAGYRRRHCQYGGPAAELLDDVVLPRCGKKQTGLEGGSEALSQIDDRLVHQQHVIVDIAKVRFDGRAAGRKMVPPQLIANLYHRRERMAHVEEPRAQSIDALNLLSGWHCQKNIVLDDFELFGDLVDDREVIVSDKVKNRVHAGVFAQAQQLRCPHAKLPYLGIGCRHTMSDRDDKT